MVSRIISDITFSQLTKYNQYETISKTEATTLNRIQETLKCIWNSKMHLWVTDFMLRCEKIYWSQNNEVVSESSNIDFYFEWPKLTEGHSDAAVFILSPKWRSSYMVTRPVRNSYEQSHKSLRTNFWDNVKRRMHKGLSRLSLRRLIHVWSMMTVSELHRLRWRGSQLIQWIRLLVKSMCKWLGNSQTYVRRLK